MKPYDEVSHDGLLTIYVDILKEIGFITVAHHKEYEYVSMSINYCYNNSRLLFLHGDCLSINNLNLLVTKLRK